MGRKLDKGLKKRADFQI